MFQALNDGSLALMVSIGHRTGLFDILATLPSSTSEEIAAAAGLNERYVREWLGALVMGDVITYQPEIKTFVLPASHAQSLTRASAPDNAAAFAQYIGLLGSVEDDIVDCFRNGGGVPYERFPRFQAVMAEDSGQSVLPAIISDILPLASGIPERLEDGIEVLDIGCRSGKAVNLMARRYGDSWFTGYDFGPDAIATARREADDDFINNTNFEVRDVIALNETDRYDLTTAFDAIHDQRDPQAVLNKVAQALRRGGTFLMQDIDSSVHLEENIGHPIGTFLYTISAMHCMTISLAQGGAGLGTMWGVEKAHELLIAAGFTDVIIHRLPHGPQNAYFVA